MHRTDDARKLDESTVVGSAQQFASRNVFRFRKARLTGHLECLHNEVGRELALLQVAPDLDFLAEPQIARPVHMHRHPDGRPTVLNGDLGLTIADVIDGSARSRLDMQTFGIRELPQLTDTEEGRLLRGKGGEIADRDQKKQSGSVVCDQTSFELATSVHPLQSRHRWRH